MIITHKVSKGKVMLMKKQKNVSIWLFFVILYLLSGLFYTPVLLSGKGIYTTLNKFLMVCTAFIPSILGVVFVRITWRKPARRDFWRRVLQWPKASPGVICLSLLLLPLLNFIAYVSAHILSGEPITLDYGRKILSQIPMLAQFLLVEFFLGAVSEELGWRGYALDMLQSRYSALTSSLLIGAIWAFWHTPAFYIPGLSQFEFGGVFSLNYLGMMVGVVSGSILHTWSYNNSGRSIALSGVLMHFTQNASLIFLGGIFDQYAIPILFWPVVAILNTITAGIVVWRTGAQTLTRNTAENAANSFGNQRAPVTLLKL